MQKYYLHHVLLVYQRSNRRIMKKIYHQTVEWILNGK